jgi:hypothetical protein
MGLPTWHIWYKRNHSRNIYDVILRKRQSNIAQVNWPITAKASPATLSTAPHFKRNWLLLPSRSPDLTPPDASWCGKLYRNCDDPFDIVQVKKRTGFWGSNMKYSLGYVWKSAEVCEKVSNLKDDILGMWPCNSMFLQVCKHVKVRLESYCGIIYFRPCTERPICRWQSFVACMTDLTAWRNWINACTIWKSHLNLENS